MNIRTKFTPPIETTHWDNMRASSVLASGGSIHIKPQNKGKFTAYANSKGMSVQQAASSVLSNPNASSTLRKRAQFAKNASHWKHGDGGLIDPTDPTKKLVDIEEGDPSFNNQIEFDHFYRQKAEGRLKESDPDLFQKYQEAISSGDDLKAQSYIAARGGLPMFAPSPQVAKTKDFGISNYTPDRTTSSAYMDSIRKRSLDTRQYNQSVKSKRMGGKIATLPSRNNMTSDPANQF